MQHNFRRFRVASPRVLRQRAAVFVALTFCRSRSTTAPEMLTRRHDEQQIATRSTLDRLWRVAGRRARGANPLLRFPIHQSTALLLSAKSPISHTLLPLRPRPQLSRTERVSLSDATKGNRER